jgi:CRP/FNR family transcriptional regulator, cyclic AMP receptor protein
MLDSFQRLLFLRKVPVFQELRDDFLLRLAAIMEEVSYGANHGIFAEGESGQTMYILISGRVKVHSGDREIIQLQRGDCFGEMSVFDSEPRSASITTLEKCECLELTQQQLYEALEETSGIAINLIRLLSQRTRKLNSRVKELEREQPKFSRPSILR